MLEELKKGLDNENEVDKEIKKIIENFEKMPELTFVLVLKEWSSALSFLQERGLMKIFREFESGMESENQNKEIFRSFKLGRGFKVEISPAEKAKITCEVCHKKLDFGDAIYLEGIGELNKEKKKIFIYTDDAILSHLKCSCEIIEEDDTVE